MTRLDLHWSEAVLRGGGGGINGYHRESSALLLEGATHRDWRGLGQLLRHQSKYKVVESDPAAIKLNYCRQTHSVKGEREHMELQGMRV